jgi:2,5-furandicarboxylate decarboxylase 1
VPKDLRTFLDQLIATAPEDIYVVDREVDPRFELTGVVSKLEQEQRFPAVFFRRVKGSNLPVIINLTASYNRLALSMDSTIQTMVQECARREEHPRPWQEVSDADAPVKEVILRGDEVDITKLPITTHNELDGGPYIGSALLLQRDPDNNKVNAGIYRHQIHGPREIGLMQNPANHGCYVTRKYEEAGKDQQVAMVIGHHPAFVMSGVAKVPGIGGELEVAGAYLNEPLEVTRGVTVDLPIPARAEIVIEGYVPAGRRHYEGPFGEWPHYYAKTGDQPVIVPTAILMRKDAIYQDIFAAHPEHNIVGALPRMGSIFRRVQEVVPTVKAVNLPYSGGGRVYCYISIRKTVDGEPKQAAFAALTAEPNIKHCIIVDDDIDVFNEAEVLWALATRFEADRDMIIMPNCLGSHLNPTAYTMNRDGHGYMQTKLIMDATRPTPPAYFPPVAKVPAEVTDKIDLNDYLQPFQGQLRNTPVHA